MNNEGKEIVNGIEVNTKKAQKILTKLIVREKTNIKTKQYNDPQMVNQIKKMIEEEVECY
ncbi:MAG: hypothetical protein VB128_00165 [Sedimentibacter saalensis]|jgi:hypothetical protein|uniref:hypothetical protein n=1 Tax=Sedimentibacter saalensis TaxID=130788 RepID=UPI000E990A0D|nr:MULTISPECIES: hypothetical protein [Bacillota]MEA5093344.1 hypothetical protein [Sedimentibacter saalensis]HBB28882.1 hypothetical protein [Clostridiales bacterium]